MYTMLYNLWGAVHGQTGAFFLEAPSSPAADDFANWPIFGRIFEFWGSAGLNGQSAMEASVFILLSMTIRQLTAFGTIFE